MESELYEMNAKLLKDQKEKILDAFFNREKIKLRFTKENLRGPNTLIVPTRFFEETDNEDGIDAVVDEQTYNEMWEEFKSYTDEPTYDKMWEYYGLFFAPAIDEDLENKGIEFNLDYSLVNDLTKDFVKDNIKKLVL